MALPVESQGLIENSGHEVHFCGIGKINAAMKTTEMILKFGYEFIVNLGTAGSSRFPTHSLIECVEFVQRDMDLTPLGFPCGETPFDELGKSLEFPAITHLAKGICGTGDSFEVGPARVNCDVVDMEAYAIAKVCKRFGVSMTSVKYITDGADHNSHNDWYENLKPASIQFLEIYEKILKLDFSTRQT